MADVARRAGVSVSTVSYVLSGARPISEDTRTRVQRAMAELNYTTNAFARALRSQRSRILAFLLPTDITATDAYTVEMLFAAADRARSDGYHLLLWTESEDESLGVCDLANDGLIDGVLLTSVLVEDSRVEALAAAGIPFVTIGRTSDCDEQSYVDTDDRQMASLVIDQLAAQGHRRVEFIGPPAADFARGVGIVLRLGESLRSAASGAGVELRTTPCDFTAAGGLEVVRRRGAQGEPPTAYVVMNPQALDGVLEGLAEQGCDVPTDVSVVALLMSARDEMTAVVADPFALGATASEVAIGILEGRVTTTKRLLETRFLPGNSFGPASS